MFIINKNGEIVKTMLVWRTLKENKLSFNVRSQEHEELMVVLYQEHQGDPLVKHFVKAIIEDRMEAHWKKYLLWSKIIIMDKCAPKRIVTLIEERHSDITIGWSNYTF